ncbi:MAG: transcriptional regulator NrdR [Candidatus Bilamarchaeaceae archaeon]
MCSGKRGRKTRMKCPYCTNPDTMVVDSRQVDAQIRRRRECEKCKKRFTTFERVEAAELYVIKKNGSRQPFNADKVRISIRKACEKRPISLGQIDRMVSEIEAKLRNEDSIEIPSSRIGDLVMARLKKADKVAYVRFASVYKDFGNLEAFEEAIEKLKGGSSDGRK